MQGMSDLGYSEGKNLAVEWRYADGDYKRLTGFATAEFVDKLLKGAKPSAMPIEQPTKFALVINMKAAKLIGLDVPPSIIAIADEVIE